MIPHTVGTLCLFVNLFSRFIWERVPLFAKSAFIGTNLASPILAPHPSDAGKRGTDETFPNLFDKSKLGTFRLCPLFAEFRP
jgi:hypothetical protein